MLFPNKIAVESSEVL